MVYRALGIMSGSSLDGLDMALVEFHEASGKWSYTVKAAACYPYEQEWIGRLQQATLLNAKDYLLLHTAFGHYMGEQVNRFVEENGLHYQVQLISSHGHTSFHLPAQKTTAQLGDGAAIAAITGINVVSDLRAMDVALGGQGAPIVPIGEKLLWPEYDILLNLGGIANLSFNQPGKYIAFDVCAANRVLNLLAAEIDKPYDEDGNTAASGKLEESLLKELNALGYYSQPYPKSLANDFGTDTVYGILKKTPLPVQDKLRTYTEHIAYQLKEAILQTRSSLAASSSLLATGGGAHNTFLVERIRQHLEDLNISLVIPEKELIDYKEAIVMALIGVLRWRENNNVLSSVTGASKDSIGGAVWIGQDA